MMKSGKTRIRLLLGLFVIFLALQVHSYWQFRYMLSDYFDRPQNPSRQTNGVAYPLIEPFGYALEVAAMRVYHLRNLWVGVDPKFNEKWTVMSSDQVYEYVADSAYLSGNTHGAGNEYFGKSQFHSTCSSVSIISQCTGRYVLFGNHLCSFRANVKISFDEFSCRQFFIHEGAIYTEDFWQVDSRGFLKDQLTKTSNETINPTNQ